MWLEGIPVPPSLNHSYPTGRWGKRYKAKELVLWERDFQAWAQLSASHIQSLQRAFKIIPPSHFLAVHCVYYFRRDRILCKNGKAKRLDVDNRLKHLLDSVTKLIGFDDSLVWQGSFYKRVATAGEHCNVQIQLIGPKELGLDKDAMATP